MILCNRGFTTWKDVARWTSQLVNRYLFYNTQVPKRNQSNPIQLNEPTWRQFAIAKPFHETTPPTWNRMSVFILVWFTIYSHRKMALHFPSFQILHCTCRYGRMTASVAMEGSNLSALPGFGLTVGFAYAGFGLKVRMRHPKWTPSTRMVNRKHGKH